MLEFCWYRHLFHFFIFSSDTFGVDKVSWLKLGYQLIILLSKLGKLRKFTLEGFCRCCYCTHCRWWCWFCFRLYSLWDLRHTFLTSFSLSYFFLHVYFDTCDRLPHDQATPHAVRGTSQPGVSRETFAVFMEPMWFEVKLHFFHYYVCDTKIMSYSHTPISRKWMFRQVWIQNKLSLNQQLPTSRRWFNVIAYQLSGNIMICVLPCLYLIILCTNAIAHIRTICCWLMHTGCTSSWKTLYRRHDLWWLHGRYTQQLLWWWIDCVDI